MKRLKLLVAALAACAATGAQAGVLSYDGFANTTGLTTVGSAATVETADGTVMRLTPDSTTSSGAVYTSSSFQLGSNASFSTSFQFRFTGNGFPADGMAFVLAASPNGLGEAGGGIGYQGVLNSVAIEFDTYNNGEDDGWSENHIGLSINGSGSMLSRVNVYNRDWCPSNPTGCLSNGNIWTANISYDGARLSMTVQDDGIPEPYLVFEDFEIDIAGILGTSQAYVGFTAATGSSSQNHDLLNWRVADSAELPPVDLPEPASLGLLGLGVAGLAAGRRIQRRG